MTPDYTTQQEILKFCEACPHYETGECPESDRSACPKISEVLKVRHLEKIATGRIM
jgi:hypothetical protein